VLFGVAVGAVVGIAQASCLGSRVRWRTWLAGTIAGWLVAAWVAELVFSARVGAGRSSLAFVLFGAMGGGCSGLLQHLGRQRPASRDAGQLLVNAALGLVGGLAGAAAQPTLSSLGSATDATGVLYVFAGLLTGGILFGVATAVPVIAQERSEGLSHGSQ